MPSQRLKQGEAIGGCSEGFDIVLKGLGAYSHRHGASPLYPLALLREEMPLLRLQLACARERRV